MVLEKVDIHIPKREVGPLSNSIYKMNQKRSHRATELAASLQFRDTGSIPSPAQLSSRIQCCCSCGLGHKCSLDLLPGPETPYAMGQPKKKKKKKKGFYKNKQRIRPLTTTNPPRVPASSLLSVNMPASTLTSPSQLKASALIPFMRSTLPYHGGPCLTAQVSASHPSQS